MGEYTVTGSGAACKAVVLDSEGSSPSSPTTMPTSPRGSIASAWATSMFCKGRLDRQV